MVKGYKTINIKEELIEKIRNLEENKKEVEEGRFNLAGFVTKALSEYMNRGSIKYEGPTTEQLIKNALVEALTITKQGNVSTTDTNAGITLEDLKRELIAVKNETVDKIKAKIDTLTGLGGYES